MDYCGKCSLVLTDGVDAHRLGESLGVGEHSTASVSARLSLLDGSEYQR